MIKVCITGYYGFDNLADEATLLSIIESLRNHIEDVEIVVFSDDPEGHRPSLWRYFLRLPSMVKNSIKEFVNAMW